ncbi:Plasmodium exported protein (hyp4), unknown, putative [Plasmodium sp. gorilla clade G1]|nr:Plasmodium exported protein (hyp4), unknown, putative [Plasmodium sp. gorilla clade G1]
MKQVLSLFKVSLFFLLIFKYSYKNLIKLGRQDYFNKSTITKYITSRTLTENNKKCEIKYMNTSIFSGNKNTQKREENVKTKKKEQRDNTKEDNDKNMQNEMIKEMKNEMKDHVENHVENHIDDHTDDHINDKLEHHNSLEDSIKEYYTLTDPSVDEENKSFLKKLKLIMNILDDTHSDLLINNHLTNGSIFSPEFVPIGVLSSITLAFPLIGTVTLPYITRTINFMTKYEGQKIHTERELKI